MIQGLTSDEISQVRLKKRMNMILELKKLKVGKKIKKKLKREIYKVLIDCLFGLELRPGRTCDMIPRLGNKSLVGNEA